MYTYKITLNDGFEAEFVSRYHVSMMQVQNINGAQMILFEDADTAVNLLHVDSMEIDGELYKLQAYNA